ncbi:MAG: GNAT family N-acetyltransferase [Xanthomonadales bacterium]|nr:GNAT family N-acetyltransferase [Xanthomonadales bacterium]
MSLLQIAPLRDWPTKLDELAAAHHAEWSPLIGPDWTLDVARAELHDSCGDAPLPATFVAVQDGEACGSVSLLVDDADDLRGYGGPWLGSLWVSPTYRRRGIGARLVRHAVEEAARRGVDRLLLFTPRHAAFYRSLGWADVGGARVRGEPVDVLSCYPRIAMQS